MLECLYSYNTRSVSNNNLFIPGENRISETMAFAGSKIWSEIPKEIRMAQTLHKHLATQQAESS